MLKFLLKVNLHTKIARILEQETKGVTLAELSAMKGTWAVRRLILVKDCNLPVLLAIIHGF